MNRRHPTKLFRLLPGHKTLFRIRLFHECPKNLISPSLYIYTLCIPSIYPLYTPCISLIWIIQNLSVVPIVYAIDITRTKQKLIYIYIYIYITFVEFSQLLLCVNRKNTTYVNQMLVVISRNMLLKNVFCRQCVKRKNTD